MNISIVVSVHNGAEKLGDCLKSLQPLEAEVIVVDHDSTDETAAVARKYTKHVYKEKNHPKAIDIQKKHRVFQGDKRLDFKSRCR